MTAIADRLATISSLRSRLRACRSFLLTPGAHPEHFAGARQGDGIIVDLESSVPPTEKDKAREGALAYLGRPIDADLVRILRINSPRTVDGLRDLLALHDFEAISELVPATTLEYLKHKFRPTVFERSPIV